ncbi:Hypothetical predicted protein [Cloeon dipterum]|uniref:Zinc transporter SLC39A7 n=1 Tax=Cloeon dipterum TaxID=197152 RepID=A0A8S1DJW5_9INSE|nr:Hypothetical predicted protein [Cloeon dipterum]
MRDHICLCGPSRKTHAGELLGRQAGMETSAGKDTRTLKMILERNSASRGNRWMYRIVVAVAIVLLVLLSARPCDGHDHLEPPSFRYSKEANIKQEHHGHSHGAGGHHGHSHGAGGHHGHSHGDAGHHEHEQEHDHGHSHGHHAEEKEQGTRPPRDAQVWLEAIGATVLISAAPFFILFLVPLDNSKEREPLLKVLLAFASGGLLGDAFLHLIPHALMAQSETEGVASHSHSHSHSHGGEGESDIHGHDMSVGLWVLFGIITFLMVEKLVRLLKDDDDHGHSHGPKRPEKKEKDSDDESEKKDSADKKKKKAGKKEKKEDKPADDIKVAGYLNLAADFTHNFTDGLAIGASFLAGRSIGAVTTATILLHEVPHEIGDFAILIQSGCSRKKAIFLQLSTAVGALTGTLVSLLADGIGGAATNWILPFTAGGFIYIATVSVIPELLVNTRFGQSVKEIIALLVGVYMMVLIADYE